MGQYLCNGISIIKGCLINKNSLFCKKNATRLTVIDTLLPISGRDYETQFNDQNYLAGGVFSNAFTFPLENEGKNLFTFLKNANNEEE